MNKRSNFSRRELKRFRRIFFPLIANGTISGYNHYPKVHKRKARFLVNYLHANLGRKPDGRDEDHKAELTDKIKISGLAHLVRRVHKDVIERIAMYRLKTDWLNEDLRLYDEHGNPLNHQDALLYGGVIIGEGKQYDLAIEVANGRDLKELLNLFGKITNKYKIDNSGNLIEIEGKKLENQEAISDAWEVPIILVSTKRRTDLDGFDRIKKIIIKKNQSEISTLIDKKEPLIKDKLDAEKIKYCSREILANRLCYNWVNKA
ncbi:MAG: hypothetical protein AABW58_01370 [Nanoarchaeota archaeon]